MQRLFSAAGPVPEVVWSEIVYTYLEGARVPGEYV